MEAETKQENREAAGLELHFEDEIGGRRMYEPKGGSHFLGMQDIWALPLMAHNVHKNMSIRKNMNKVFIRKA